MFTHDSRKSLALSAGGWFIPTVSINKLLFLMSLPLFPAAPAGHWPPATPWLWPPEQLQSPAGTHGQAAVGRHGCHPGVLDPRSQGNAGGFGTYLRSESSRISPRMTSLASAGSVALALLEGGESGPSYSPNQEFQSKSGFYSCSRVWIHPPFPWLYWAVPRGSGVDLASGVPWLLPSSIQEWLQGKKGAEDGAQGDGEGPS